MSWSPNIWNPKKIFKRIWNLQTRQLFWMFVRSYALSTSKHSLKLRDTALGTPSLCHQIYPTDVEGSKWQKWVKRNKLMSDSESFSSWVLWLHTVGLLFVTSLCPQWTLGSGLHPAIWLQALLHWNQPWQVHMWVWKSLGNQSKGDLHETSVPH